jgi:ArsR family transcriptional regulator
MATSALLDQLPALVDPTRVRLLHVLAQHELTVGEICNVVQLPQSTVSRQLRTLSDESWVSTRAEGTSRYYRMNPDLGDSARQLWDLVAIDLASDQQAIADAARVQAVLARRRTRSREFFAEAARDWEKIRESVFGERASLIGLVGLIDDQWIVGDLGCGTGHLTRLLAPFVRRVIGVDASAAMLDQARVNIGITPNVELRSGELENLPLENHALDAAVLALVLHNVADPIVALREAVRVLRPGGRLLILDMMSHDRDDLRQRLGHVWQGFSRDQVTTWMQQAGCVRSRFIPLPPDLSTDGPALFAATAIKSP